MKPNVIKLRKSHTFVIPGQARDDGMAYLNDIGGYSCQYMLMINDNHRIPKTKESITMSYSLFICAKDMLTPT